MPNEEELRRQQWQTESPWKDPKFESLFKKVDKKSVFEALTEEKVQE